MSDAIFLCDASQIPAALRLQRRLGAGALLVTGDMTTAWELERHGVPFLDEHDEIGGDELLANWEAADRLAAHWWGDAEGDVGEATFAAARGDLRLPIELCLDAATAYRRLLAQRRIGRAHVFFVPPVAICRTQPAPGLQAAASLAQAVLRREAERAGVAAVPVRSLRPLVPEGPRARAAPATAAEVPRPAATGQGRTALLLDTGMRAAEAALLAGRLAAEPGWRVVRLTPWELAAGGPLDCPWVVPDAVGVPADLLDNPYLRFQLARVAAELRAAARIGAAFGALLDVLRPALCVLGPDAFTVERVLVRVARRHGVPAASLIHGGFRPRRIYRDVTGEADRLLVWGPEDVAGLSAAGIDRDRIRAVGSVLYAERSRRAPAQPGDAETARARAAIGLPADRPLVLLLTATIAKGLAAIARPATQRACWREIAALAARRPDLTFAIKPHPSYDHFELYRRLAGSGPANLLYLEDVSLAAALAATTVSVLINYATTAAMEGLHLGIPTVFWQADLLPGNGDDPLAGGGAVAVDSILALEAAIDRLVRDEAARTTAVTNGLRACARFVGDPEPPPLERTVAALVELADGSGPPAPASGRGATATAAAHQVGAHASSPGALRAALATAFAAPRESGALSGRDRRRAAAAGYLAAIAARDAAGDIRGSRAYAFRLLLTAPGVVLSWPTIRRAVARRLLAGTAPGRALLDLPARARELVGRWRGGYWRPPRVER